MQHPGKRQIKPYPVSKESNHTQIIVLRSYGHWSYWCFMAELSDIISGPNYVSLYKVSLEVAL